MHFSLFFNNLLAPFQWSAILKKRGITRDQGGNMFVHIPKITLKQDLTRFQVYLSQESQEKMDEKPIF